MRGMNPHRKRFTRLPTSKEIAAINCAHITEFELNDKETRTLRAELYRINRDGVLRYRTLRELNVILVWRIK